jgi:hypothetical protein
VTYLVDFIACMVSVVPVYGFVEAARDQKQGPVSITLMLFISNYIEIQIPLFSFFFSEFYVSEI